MRFIFMILAVVFLLTGCFDTKETITGQAFLKTNGGDVKTCAGETVYVGNIAHGNRWLDDLISAFMTRDMYAQKGESKKYELQNTKILEHLEKANANGVVKTVCDANGKFRFDNLRYGEYRVVTNVIWDSYGGHQGGVVAKTINLQKESEDIIIRGEIE